MSDPFDLSDAEPEPPRGPGATAPLDAPAKPGHDDGVESRSGFELDT